MKRSTSHRTAVLLLVGLVCLAIIQANPSAAREDKQIELASAPFGITEGQTVSLSVVVYGSRPISMNDAVDARMQLLDADGEVIAESQNIGVLPVQVRSWVVPRELLPTGEPSGRIQVRARILVISPARLPSPPPLAGTVELFDTATGSTSAVWVKLRIKQEFPES